MNNDPKYYVLNNNLYHINGNKIPEDEPIMIFRGKDIGSLVAICSYIEMLLNEDFNKQINDHLISSCERLIRFYNYQMNNPNIQSVTCSKDNHKNSSLYLNRAKNLIKEISGDK
jgi:hypothetical protein